MVEKSVQDSRRRIWIAAQTRKYALMPMPTVFDGYVERSAKVSSTCLVAVAKNRYSVLCELAGQRVGTRLYPSRVEIASNEAIVASHVRVANHGPICYDWQHAIARIQRKPGALRTCRRHCCVCAKG